jgi:hypothetical protein
MIYCDAIPQLYKIILETRNRVSGKMEYDNSTFPSPTKSGQAQTQFGRENCIIRKNYPTVHRTSGRD